MRKTTSLITFAGVALAAACHSAPPPETPAPMPTEAEAALYEHSHVPVDAAAGRTADSVEWARQLELVERAYRDSVEQVRLALETAGPGVVDEAALKDTELRDELAVMVRFPVAQAQLMPDGRAALDRKVAILNANSTVRLRITGACDERGSDRYNMALGERRAAAVKRYLVGKGIDVARLDEASSGERSPVDSGSDEAAWARNRRAEFEIVGNDVSLTLK